MNWLRDDLAHWFEQARGALDGGPAARHVSNRSAAVERVGDGVAIVAGLPGRRLDELLRFERRLCSAWR